MTTFIFPGLLAIPILLGWKAADDLERDQEK